LIIYLDLILCHGSESEAAAEYVNIRICFASKAERTTFSLSLYYYRNHSSLLLLLFHFTDKKRDQSKLTSCGTYVY